MTRRPVVASAALAIVISLTVGVRWASEVNWGDQYRDDAPPMSWAGHSPIRDSDGDRVGWIAHEPGGGMIVVAIPQSDTSVGVSIVYNDAGDPIGIFGSRGFQRGVIRNGTELDPVVRQQIIDDALAQPNFTTTIPSTVPAISD